MCEMSSVCTHKCSIKEALDKQKEENIDYYGKSYEAQREFLSEAKSGITVIKMFFYSAVVGVASSLFCHFLGCS